MHKIVSFDLKLDVWTAIFQYNLMSADWEINLIRNIKLISDCDVEKLEAMCNARCGCLIQYYY